MASTSKKQESTKQPQTPVEATYTIDELVAAAKTEFNTTSIIVRAALMKAGKHSYTIREAKQLVERMKNKEVKR